MKKYWKPVLTVVFALLLSTPVFAEESGSPFTDMTGTEYYAEAAAVLSGAGILGGYADGAFHAERLVTRAEMAAIVCRMTGRDGEAAKGESVFPDVPSNYWAGGYINLARDIGITSGGKDGCFHPEAPVKYQEAVKMVVCALGAEGSVKTDPADWSAGYLGFAEEKHITDGLAARKGQALTRGDTAVLVYNALYHSRIGLDGFTVDSWIDAGRVGIDYNTTHGSEYSICISSEQRNAFSLVKTCPVKPNTYYTASAYVKTENLLSVERGDVGANISADIPANASNGGWTLSKNLIGDHDWTKLTLLLYSGGATELKVSFNYGFYGNTCTGKLYFDDISFEEYKVPSTSEWKMLFAILPNSEIPWKDANGKEYIAREGISARQIEDIKETARLFTEDIYQDSGGRMRVNVETKVIGRPVTRLRDTGDENTGYTLYTEDAYEIIKDEVDIDEYDYIMVFANLNMPDYPKYYGLSFSNWCYLPFRQGTGYAVANTQIADCSDKVPWRPALMVHEFLHAMEDWCRMLNQGLPFEVDRAEAYGYTKEDGGYYDWRKFYIDIMNQDIPLENGEKAGIPDAVWNVTPKEFRFTRVNFRYEEG